MTDQRVRSLDNSARLDAWNAQSGVQQGMPFVRSTPRAEVESGSVEQRTPRAGIADDLVLPATGIGKINSVEFWCWRLQSVVEKWTLNSW